MFHALVLMIIVVVVVIAVLSWHRLSAWKSAWRSANRSALLFCRSGYFSITVSSILQQVAWSVSMYSEILCPRCRV